MNGIRHARCEVCGKRQEATTLLVAGGPFLYICKDCRPKAEIVIKKYRALLSRLSFEVVCKSIIGLQERKGVKANE